MNVDTQPRFVDTLAQAAKDNPLAAALIGGGALWLLFGKGASTAYTEVVRPAAEIGLRGAARAASELAADETAGFGRKEEVKADASRATGIKDMAETAIERTKQQVRDLPAALPDVGKRVGEARSVFGELLEQQPLILGAIGVAIGAGIASTAAITLLEEEWVGGASCSFKKAVMERAGSALETVGDSAHTIGNEVKAAATKTVDVVRTGGNE